MRDRDPEIGATFHRLCPLPQGMVADDVVDDGTWRDLGVEALLDRLDSTITTPGECVLYRLLRTPMAAQAELAARRQAIRLLVDAPNGRVVIQQALEHGRRHLRDGLELIRLLWAEPVTPKAHRWKYSVMAILGAVAIIGLMWTLLTGTASLAWFVALLAMYACNISVHHVNMKALDGRLDGLSQLRGMVRGASSLAATVEPALADALAELLSLQPAVRPIERRLNRMLHLTSIGRNQFTEIALDYVNMFFLQEVRTFYALLPLLHDQRSELQRVFTLMGEWDAWQSVANYRDTYGVTTEPVLDDNGPALAVTCARHPLIENAIANSLTLAAGAVITGSNMSGKTTFLRTIAVNALLAQTLDLCHADEFRGRRVRIFAVLDEGDDLEAGKSYFLCEAERLLKLVRLAESEIPVLALVDEPLAGTNSPQRFAASQAILRYAAERSGRVLVTTHDVELARLLQNSRLFDAYNFSDYAGPDGMTFDYALHTGIDYHANAIEVLKRLGYPTAITDAARSAVEHPLPAN